MAHDIREIRNWARFIGILIMLTVVASIITAVAIAVHSHSVYCNNNPLNC